MNTVTATPQTCRGTDGEKVTCRWTEIIILRKEVQREVWVTDRWKDGIRIDGKRNEQMARQT